MSFLKAAVVCVVATPALAQYPDGKALVNDAAYIGRINAVEGKTWTAGVNEFFGNMTFDDARALLGTDLTHISEHLDKCLDDSVYAAVASRGIPSDFDAVARWSGLVHPIRNQMQCGSCWAFSATEVLGDRFAIAAGQAMPALSVEDAVSCDSQDNGCHGGTLPNAWEYLESVGVVTDSCFPYTAGRGTEAACRTSCVDYESFTKYQARNAYAIRGVTNMQAEIMTNGPIQVAYKVYKSFMNYQSGVYMKQSWESVPEGGHAVKMVGWGTEMGNDYWLVANSWGASWGLDGFFMIARGADECGIETMGPPYAGMPAIGEASRNALVV